MHHDKKLDELSAKEIWHYSREIINKRMPEDSEFDYKFLKIIGNIVSPLFFLYLYNYPLTERCYNVLDKLIKI